MKQNPAVISSSENPVMAVIAKWKQKKIEMVQTDFSWAFLDLFLRNTSSINLDDINNIRKINWLKYVFVERDHYKSNN